jgi:hypothetical protein
MTWQITTPQIGYPTITDTDTTQKVALGTVVRAFDSTYGEGEFIYLKGVASTVAGDAVVYDEYAATTTRTVAASRGPVAVAMSANVANQYGWYQVKGAALTNTAASGTAGGFVCVTATAGTVDDAGTAVQVDGAVYRTATGTPSAGKAVLEINRPSANGQGTIA